MGAEVGALGLGVGHLGLAGTSQVNLTASGTTRDSLMSDGFVAVLEQDTPDGPDTLRLVVPSEQAARELVSALLDGAVGRFTRTDRNGRTVAAYPVAHATLRRLAPDLLAFPDEASYVSDRLHAVLRMPEASNPSISVWGVPLSRHAILGSAIQIGTEGSVQPLFPVELLQAIREVTERAVLATTAGAPTQGTIANQLPSSAGDEASEPPFTWPNQPL